MVAPFARGDSGLPAANPHAAGRMALLRHLDPDAIGAGKGAKAAAALLCLGILAAALAVGYVHPGAPSTGPLHPGQKSAAIVDQLSMNAPNPSFREEATAMLEAAGYVVDYHPSEDVTVAFYRNLPARGHQILLLRSHASATAGGGGDAPPILFTAQLARRELTAGESLGGLRLAQYEDSPETYFGIGDRFVRDTMRGDFGGALVVNMGCEGAKTDSLAMAFLDRGAGTYIGWDQQVTAGQTDQAALALLGGYLEGQSIEDAVRQATRASPGLGWPHSPKLLWATADPAGNGGVGGNDSLQSVDWRTLR